MKSLSGILFPVAVSALALAGALGFESEGVSTNEAVYEWGMAEAQDTVIYPADAYKFKRIGDFDKVSIDDSLFSKYNAEEDTLPHLTARDTIKAPDSLRLTDPFRYRFYVALLDSLTHAEVRDSLRKSEKSFRDLSDTLHYRMDSMDLHKLDSIYYADSTVRAKAAFLAWYNSLSKDERKKYDYEQKVNLKMKQMDSIRKVDEEKQAIKDSIRENTPRVLETFMLPDSMQYKRIIAWTVDPDFQKIKTYVPDTSFNHYYYDYKFMREDVNSSWLGVAGSPVQSYNYFNRKSDSGVDFYAPNESWSFSTKSLPTYNTKTPYTELAYWGTLFSKKAKESDNVHIFTTQNILPSWNISLLYDRWGGGGMLSREETNNKTFSLWTNFLGKKYALRAGFIHNKVIRQENGGMVDVHWLRDTIVDTRDIPVNLQNAESEMKQNTFFLEQQFRIPFNFINKIKARKDSTFKFDADSLDKDITTAFIGHSSEFSMYSRHYLDKISSDTERKFYTGPSGSYQSYYDPSASNDSLYLSNLDNKVFIKFQPWSSDGVVSKINVGIGDYLRSYYLMNLENPTTGDLIGENSVYLYGGVEGFIKKAAHWDAKGNYVLAGADFANFGIEANAGLDLYPFRKAKKSPLSISAHFETNLKRPDFYQRRLNANHYSWDNDFKKVSTTKIEGRLGIPHWKLDAMVGYALMGNMVYYDTLSIARQNEEAMSILTASLRKDFVIGNVLHLDNKILFQMSSNQEVVPLPLLSFNLRYYVEFVVARDQATKTHNVMVMQIGANAFYNTKWYAPGFNPNLGVFYNQNKVEYNNGPIIDVFMNVQWKRACVFLKFENCNKGWPMKKNDSFTAHQYLYSPSSFKIGIFWPFYLQPNKNPKVN